MNLRKLAAVLPMILACALVAAFLGGCATSGDTPDAASQNRSYMAQANTAMRQLNADLEPFNAAVAEGNIVTMEQAADQAYRDIDAFKAISAPDAMKDIHAEYCAGCDDLKQALQAYVQLYRNLGSMDDTALNSGIASIQTQYDSGISHMQKADKMVTELTGALPSESSSSNA